ncbi:winged helix DNA-binding domain-containing protein [Planobispora rosea]|nr:winged helix DNA-binding domain-containing protein [Planobispora rosea]
MSLTPRQLNRATLDRQLLLRREPLNAADAVRRIVAVQAQEAASPYIALWNRLAGFDAADLDAAFADRAVVKASLMRITLHAVHAEDYPEFHNAMWRTLRAARLGDSRFTSSGLSTADADALLPHLAAFTVRPRTVTEVEDLLAARLGERKRGVWWALRTFAPLHHTPTGGPWSFGAWSSFVAAPAKPEPAEEDTSVQRLLLRYLQAFGPASMRDFAQFTMLRRPVAAQALRALADRVEERQGPGGETLFDVAGASLPAEDTVAPPRLLPMWDSTLLAYSDRSRIIPQDYRALVIRRNGDVLPALLVDGYVAGVWRPAEGGIEATAFHRLDEGTWEGLAAEARALVAFLADREPAVYRRYAHWWAKHLPGAEVRLLPG